MLSEEIVKHLYDQSEHPHIKSGEVYIAHIENVSVDNIKVDALGIFKSELKQDFLQFRESGENLEMLLEQGINLNKLDKGCLILNHKQEEGYKILSVDANRYDTKYWFLIFLRWVLTALLLIEKSVRSSILYLGACSCL